MLLKTAWVLDRRNGRIAVRKETTPATRRQYVLDPIRHLAEIRLARPSHASRLRNQRPDDFPFRIRQVISPMDFQAQILPLSGLIPSCACLHLVVDLPMEHHGLRSLVSDGTASREEAIIARYSDDVVVGFKHRRAAERFPRALGERLGQFELAARPKNTRLIEFGLHAGSTHRVRGSGRLEVFDVPGFALCCRKNRERRFCLEHNPDLARVPPSLLRIGVTVCQGMHHGVHEVA